MMMNCCSPSLQSHSGLGIFSGKILTFTNHPQVSWPLVASSFCTQPRVCSELGGVGDLAGEEVTCTVTELCLEGNMNQ